MKRIISLLLIFAAIVTVFAACTPADNKDNDSEVTSSESQSPNDDSGFDKLGFAIFPEGNYLADPKFDTDEFLPEYDSDPAFTSHYGTSCGALFAETDSTWYYAFAKNSDLIMYKDKATGIGGPLCGKPECTHTNSSCNAYIGKTFGGLSVYDGRLYYYNHSNIISMDLDGTDRKTVSLPNTNVNIYDYMSGDIYEVIHRGYIYYCGVGGNVENGEACYDITVVAQPIDGSAEKDIVFHRRFFDDNYHAEIIKLVGNDLYICEFNSNKTYTAEGFQSAISVYRLDTKTRKGELVFCDEYSGSIGIDPWDFYVVPEDGIYYGKRVYEFDEGKRTVVDMSIGKYSFETEKTGDIRLANLESINYYPAFYYSDDYIICENIGKGTVYVWDHKGNLLHIVTNEKIESSGFTGANKDCIYLFAAGYHDSNGDFHAFHHTTVPLDGGDIVHLDAQGYLR